MYYLGIDGGGSTLRVVVVRENMAIVALVPGPSVNPAFVGHETAEKHIRAAVADVLELADATPDDFAGVGIGMAGMTGPEIRQHFGDFLPGVPQIGGNDTEAALVGAHGQHEGILLLAGTGSAAYGVANGKKTLVGGWGYLVGDEGSGYWLGLHALMAALYHSDGRGEPTALTELLLNTLDIPDARAVIPWIYAEPRNTKIASLAPLVLDAADAGDAVAGALVETAAHDLVAHVRAVRQNLNAPDVPVAFAGGLITRQNRLSRRVVDLLGLDALPAPQYPPVIGAALMAKLSR